MGFGSGEPLEGRAARESVEAITSQRDGRLSSRPPKRSELWAMANGSFAGHARSVNTHLFVYTTRTGDQSAEELEFRNDEMAIVCGRSLLDGETVSVGVRRVLSRGGFERLGLWVWNRGQARWKAGE